MKNKHIFFMIASIALGALCYSGLKTNSDAIPKVKQTRLSKYLTSEEAHELLSQDESILFIDVRDSVEVAFTGHPASIDAIIPLSIQSSIYDSELHEYTLLQNTAFLTEMEEVFKLNGKTKTDKIIMTCGSGMRSAIAANKLIEAGYTDVWHIPDGYEGDDKRGLNTQNAWKIAGLPWSKELVHGSEWRLIVPEVQASES